MNALRQCPSCQSTVGETDRFCTSCGLPVGGETVAEGGTACPLCGRQDPPGTASCSACGARLGGVVTSPKAPLTADHLPSKDLAPFQSWKFTLSIAAALVLVLVILVISNRPSEQAAAPSPSQEDPHATPMMARLRELQVHLETHPDDAPATLELANLLYDVHFFDRAAVLYDRYLEMNPRDTDARVDLGTSYFQMSFADSAAGQQLILRADSCFRKAIEIKPDHQLAHFNLGVIKLQQGDNAEARAWFSRCIAIDSTSESARRATQLISEYLQGSQPTPSQ